MALRVVQINPSYWDFVPSPVQPIRSLRVLGVRVFIVVTARGWRSVFIPNQDNENDGQELGSKARSSIALQVALSAFIDWLEQEAERIENNQTRNIDSSDNSHGSSGESEE